MNQTSQVTETTFGSLFPVGQVNVLREHYTQMVLTEEDIGKLAVYKQCRKACENALELLQAAAERGESIDRIDQEAFMIPSSDGEPYRTGIRICMCKSGNRVVCKHRIVVHAIVEIIYGEPCRIAL